MRFSQLRPVSIRSRLLVYFVLIVVLTAAAIAAITMLLGAREARSRVIGQLRSVLTLKEQEIASWAEGLELNLDIVISQENIQEDIRTLSSVERNTTAYLNAYSRVQEQFVWAAQRMLLFEEIFFMNSEGTVLLSTNPNHENQKLGLNDFFSEGLKGSYIQQPSYSLSLGKMTLVASKPVSDGGEVLGVIAGRANLEGLNEIMGGRAGLGETGETYLVGSNHRLLTDLRREGYSIPDTYIRTAATDAAIGEQVDGAAAYRGYAGTTVIGVYGWISPLKVALIAEQDESEALRPERLILMTTGGLGLLAVLLAIMAGTVVTRNIVRPLADLSGTAGRIASGELDVIAPVGREDEIGSLAESFNRMTAQLRDVVRNLEKRTHHLRAINEAGRQISSILELDELLPYVARSLLETFDYEDVRILLLDGRERAPEGASGPGREAPPDTPGAPAEAGPGPGYGPDPGGEREASPDAGEASPDASGLGASSCGTLWTYGDEPCAESRRISVDELRSFPALAKVAQEGASLLLVPGAPLDAAQSEIAVPLRIGEELVGALDITARAPHLLDEQDRFAAETLADQLAIAIDNSRLYRQAHELAAGRERQRLARDLHDAVSQTLFSASLIAEVLPRIYGKNPEMGRQRLEELRQLTRGALAEMRTLLLELRPAALAQASLPELLRQLSEAVIGRARIPVELVVDGCGQLPAEVRVAVYRIAQEALNNVVKHARASKARVCLTCDSRVLRLEVEDDGAGFDPEAAGSGRLGMGIMRERADAVGARLTVTSAPSQGCLVVLIWPLPIEQPLPT